jgi:hypothetical protein
MASAECLGRHHYHPFLVWQSAGGALTSIGSGGIGAWSGSCHGHACEDPFLLEP